MNLPQLPTDKANHAIYGAVIFNVAFFASHSLAIASGVVAFMAVAKEISDAVINWRATGDPMHGPHGVEFLDAVATCFGGVLAALPLVVLRH
jgi:Fe2+ transport system protein B